VYRNVLAPVDGSSFSEHAIPYAGAIARRAGARLHVVLVHTPLPTLSAEIAPTELVTEWEDAFRQKEARYLDALVKTLQGQGLDAVAETLEGDVAPRLIKRAGSEADIVVMATHGRGGLERAWLGTVADEVIHHVKLPVLLMRPQEGEGPEHEPHFEHILVATDGSKAAAAATEQAVAIARLFGARLTLVRVVSVPAGLSSPYIPHAALLDREVTERREQYAQAFLEELAAQLGNGVKVETRLVHAYHPARGILDAIEDSGCDLVALGTHRRTRVGRIVLGSIADKVVRAAPVPVLVGHADK
jgi:nucleotide-binding universal stress UspA family protein